MKVISNSRVFDFDKVASLSYHKNTWGAGFIIEIKNVSNGYFDDIAEIAMVSSLEVAQELVRVITKKWADNEPVFDVDCWLKEHIFSPVKTVEI